VALGTFALENNVTGSSNTATGYGALLNNTESGNTANGYQALTSSVTGQQNTAIGYQALFSNTAGANTATGYQALLSNTTGSANTADGIFTLSATTTGSGNTASGAGALGGNTTGSNNTAIGANTLSSANTGDENTAVGFQALSSNTDGIDNTAIGFQALSSNTDGVQNTAVGSFALLNNTGVNNTAIGLGALLNNTTGGANIAIGFQAGGAVTTGSQNILIGNSGFSDDLKTIRIGQPLAQTQAFIAGIFNSAITGTPVVVDGGGRLGVAASSKRFKDAIKPMNEASDSILALKPVAFHYKQEIDPAAIPQFGLVAEEVEKVNPALITRDAEGKPFTVRYDAVNAMLLNEFLKEHRKVQEQETTIAQLKKEMEAVVAHLQEQDSKIQKVSDQIQTNSSTAKAIASAR